MFRRRLFTFPLVIAAAVLLLLASPIWVPLAGLVATISSKRRGALRAGLFVLGFLWAEVVAIVVVCASTPLRLVLSAERWAWWHVHLQSRFTRALYTLGRRLFRLRLEVHGDEVFRVRPAPLLFMRHRSIGDTMIPSLFATQRHGVRLRYVLKEELRFDPALDLVGHRIPNLFVRRGSGDGAREAARVAALAEGLRDDEGIILYPEGTFATPEKRARALAHLERAGRPNDLALAKALRHVLPPRFGGPLALLADNPGRDVVFCAHAGFEGAAKLRSLVSGAWLDQTIQVYFWRVPFDEIPREPDAQRLFLWNEWARMDAEVGRLLERAAARASTRGDLLPSRTLHRSDARARPAFVDRGKLAPGVRASSPAPGSAFVAQSSGQRIRRPAHPSTST